MEFSVKRSDLLDELELTQGVVERKTTIPILSNLLVEAKGSRLTITATDLELSIRTSCDAKVKKEGAGTIPAKKLFELLRLLPEGEVKFKLLENHWVHIISDRRNYKLVGMSKDNFPARPGQNSRQAPRGRHCQNHLRDLTRRIPLHAEWRAAGAEARLTRHGGNRRSSPRDG